MSTGKRPGDGSDRRGKGKQAKITQIFHAVPQSVECQTPGNSNSTTDQQQHQQGRQWWLQQPSDPAVAHVRLAGSTKAQPLRLSTLQQVCPCELVLNFLPAALSKQLLGLLLEQSAAWKRGTWWFAGQQQTAPRTTMHYQLQLQGGTSAEAGRLWMPDELAAAGLDTSAAAAAAAANTQLAAAAAAGSLPQQQAVELPAPPQLVAAADLVAAAVSCRLAVPAHATWQQQLQQLNHSLAAVQQQQQQQQRINGDSATAPASSSGGSSSSISSAAWRPSYVLANLYVDGQESVGAHHDCLTSLGPLPTVASLSLGAARTFRLHPADSAAGVAAAAAAAGIAAGVAGSSGGSRGPRVTSVDIPLPHNSLLIMWPPTQEEWTHEVPKTSKPVTPHAVSGTARINLTFRQLQQDWADAAPHCHCGRRSVMKCSVRDKGPQRHVYYYKCDNSTTQQPCNFYQAAVVSRQ